MKFYALIFPILLAQFAQRANAQTTPTTGKQWETGFFASGCFNVMTAASYSSNNNSTFNGNFNTSTNVFGVNRTWKFEYQSGFSMGVFGRRVLGENFSTLIECNILLSRQTAVLDETPILTTPQNLTSIFNNFVATQGTTTLNNLYLQIPFLLCLRLDKATNGEAGLFMTSSLANNSTQDIKVSTLTEFNSQTGVVTTLAQPKILTRTAKPDISLSLGWVLGFHYTINPKFGVRVRYEGGLTSFSEFSDLRENRMSVGVSCTMN